ncbi:MAG: histidine phosphatase family protein [Candidatus Dormiibacterota bacterium]
MKTIHLLRHAKASSSEPAVDDHERRLARRGERDARRLAQQLVPRGIAPALVLCSSAKRCRETLELIARSLPGTTKIVVEDELYAAPVEALLQRLRRLPDVIPSTLLIGHNPGLQDLALALAGRGPDVDALRGRFPTCALVTLRTPVATWRDVAPGCAQVIDSLTPEKL